MNIFTLGYQGATLETYISTLEKAEIDLVIDVRETAWSYKPGFSKAPLRTGLLSAGINYLHLKSAGNPSSNRKTAKNPKHCLARYKKHLRSNPECLEELTNFLLRASKERKRICLTCFERHAVECHRSVILSELQTRISEISPVHLYLPE